jgi:signal transduction histidine kinase
VSRTLEIVETALLWSACGAAAAWLISWPLRRRSQSGALVSVSLVATVASVAAVIGNTRAMFLTMESQYITIGVAVIAGLLAAGTAAASARSLRRGTLEISAAVDAIRLGDQPLAGSRRLPTELAQLRRQLAETAETLAETRSREHALENSRHELVAWISHDLRTPLAGLRAMAEALEDGVAAVPQTYYKRIKVEVDRLTGMVNDLFEISRLQAGTHVRSHERVNLEDLVSDCVAAMEPVASLRGVRLVGESSTAAEVLGNGGELNRALTNLVVNAIRYSAPDGVVRVSLRASEDRAAAVVLVRDSCGGIDPHDLSRIFDVGFRGEPARTPQNGLGLGAGLGLSISRGIVDAHAGRIAASNVEGGCEFVVRLPLAS